MSEPTPATQYHLHCDNLPRKAQNLARRALNLTHDQRGVRIKLELITVGDRWLLMVNDGAKVEDLGE